LNNFKSMKYGRDSVAMTGTGLAFLVMAGSLAAFYWLFSAQHYGYATGVLMAGTVVNFIIASYFWKRTTGRRMAALESNRAEAVRARHDAQAEVNEKSRLIATMSHEVRTPLNGVIGMVNLLLETELTQEQRNYAEMANASSRMLLSIVDEVLDRAKSDATGHGANTAFDPRLLVESASELLAARAVGKVIDVSTYVAPHVPQLLPAGETALRQIVFNLAGNAIKFTERGHVAIEISVQDENWLVLCVSDTGIGMSEDQLARVFNDFEQATPETSLHFGGTGLGLGIVRSLVEKQNGRVAVTSTPGHGTSFTIHLPLGCAPQAVDGTRQPLAGRVFKLAMTDSAARRHLQQSLVDLGGIVTVFEEVQDAAAGETLIADAALLSVLPKTRRSAKNTKSTWVVLKPEERRVHRELLASDNAGYLLKPLRRSSLLARLASGDAARLSATAKSLRSMVGKAKAKSGLHVLVADDNPVNLLLAKTMLEKAGHAVATATSGDAVLDQLAAGPAFDMVLLDVEMPGLNGYQTARAIRSRETATGKRLPILGLTAHARPEELQACLAAGMDDYLSKPFDSEDLAEMITKLRKKAAA
jgi:signal transduction histidine kinase/CheY-like chemotaxis protein